MHRLVSLAPSATATIEALGATDRLVGVTAHCESVPAPAIGGWLNPNYDRLDELDPDLVLTADALQADVRDAIKRRGFRCLHQEPTTLVEVIDGFVAIGEAIDCPEAGRKLKREALDRIERVRQATPDEPAEQPVVYCEEWPDPPMAAGNWVPEVVETAGARYPFKRAGERSSPVDSTTVSAELPEHVFIHHCGRGESASVDLASRWALETTVHVLDDSLLNQPSPRLVDGIERIAETLHGVTPSPDPLGAK